MTFSPFPNTTPPAPTMKVMIVDAHAAIIEMMASVIEAIDGFAVVATAQDAESAMDVFSGQPADLVIVDLDLPDVSGFSLVDQLGAVSPTVKVLIFTGVLDQTSMRRAVATGVLGVVEKAAPLAIFCDALRSVAAGRTYFGPLAGELLKELVVRNPRGAPEQFELTKREKTVLSFVALGLSSKEIAQKMGLSVHTIMNHRSNLMKKTGLHRVAQLSRYAVQTGLVADPVGNRSGPGKTPAKSARRA